MEIGQPSNGAATAIAFFKGHLFAGYSNGTLRVMICFICKNSDHNYSFMCTTPLGEFEIVFLENMVVLQSVNLALLHFHLSTFGLNVLSTNLSSTTDFSFHRRCGLAESQEKR
jgi:hypothetical protein